MSGRLGVERWLALSLPELGEVVRQAALGNAALECRLDPARAPRLSGPPAGESLRDRLSAQVREGIADPLDAAVAEFLIGSLDENGYLALHLGEVAEGLAVEPERAERVLRVVQGFDPPGIAARSVPESLSIQLRARGAPDLVALEIVERHLDDLSRHRHTRLARSLGRPIERIRAAVEVIRGLEPRPGQGRTGAWLSEAIPDVLVERRPGGYGVAASEHWPRPRLRPDLARLLRTADMESRRYLQEQARTAHWLLRAVARRRRILLRVVASLVRRCPALLDGRRRRCRPVPIRQVAEDAGIGERQVRRVTANALVQTPRGVLALRDLLGPSGPSGGRDDDAPRPAPRGGRPRRPPAAARALVPPAPEPEPATVLWPRRLPLPRRRYSQNLQGGLLRS